MRPQNYIEAYNEALRRWDFSNPIPSTVLEGARREHFARDWAWRRFDSPETNAIRRQAYLTLQHHLEKNGLAA